MFYGTMANEPPVYKKNVKSVISLYPSIVCFSLTNVENRQITH